MVRSVYVAVQGSDAGDEVLGVYATSEAAIDALKTRSYRGCEETVVRHGFSAHRRHMYWWLTNEHVCDTAARRFVGHVREYPVMGLGVMQELAEESA